MGTLHSMATMAEMSTSSNNDSTVPSVGSTRFADLVDKRHVEGTKRGYTTKVKVLCKTLRKTDGKRCVEVIDEGKDLYRLVVPRKKKRIDVNEAEDEFNI